MFQQSLGLRDEDVQSIEETIIKLYNNKFQKYEQDFRQLIREEFPPIEIPHTQLKQSSGLGEEKINEIEYRVLAERQTELKLFEEALRQAIQRGFILINLFNSSPSLRDISQSSNLCDKDIERIYSRLKKDAIKKYLSIVIILSIITLIITLNIAWQFIDRQPKQNPSEPLINISNQISRGEKSLFKENISSLISIKNKELKQEGIKLFENGKYKEAAEKFNTYLSQYHNDPEALIFKNNAKAKEKGSPLTPLTIAVSVPIGGGNDSIAMEMLRGVAQAQEEFNKGNGGRLLEVVIGSDENKGNVAKNIAQEFVKPEKSILAVVGHNTDAAFSEAQPVYTEGQMVVITPTSLGRGSPEPDFAYRAIPDVDSIIEGFAKEIKKLPSITNILICVDHNSEDNARFVASFVHSVKDKNIKINSTNCNLEQENLNPQVIISILENAIKEGANAVLLAPHVKNIPQAIAVAKENKNRESSNQKSLILLGSHAMNTYKTLQGKDAVKGMRIAVPWNPKDGKGKTFRKAANELWKGDINWRTAMTYDVTNAIIQILRKNPNVKVSPQQLRQYSGQSATGDINFKDKLHRDLSVSLLEVKENRNGKETSYKFEPL